MSEVEFNQYDSTDKIKVEANEVEAVFEKPLGDDGKAVTPKAYIAMKSGKIFVVKETYANTNTAIEGAKT